MNLGPHNSAHKNKVQEETRTSRDLLNHQGEDTKFAEGAW